MKPRPSNSTPALSSPIPAVFGTRPAATRKWLPSIVRSLASARTVMLTALPDWPLRLEDLGRDEALDAFLAQNSPYLVRDVRVLPAHELRTGLDDRHFGCRSGGKPAPIRDRHSRRRSRSDAPAGASSSRASIWVSGFVASRPGTPGISACVPTLRKIRSPASVRTPPSFRLTSSVFGPTKRPFPMINSAPLALYFCKCAATCAATISRLRSANLGHVDLDRARSSTPNSAAWRAR